MGRPIKKRYFAGTAVVADTAGMGVVTPSGVTVVTSGTNYSAGTTLVFSQPDILGGAAAQGTVTVVGGNITAVTVTSAGSGYTADPAIALTNVGTGTGATFTVALAPISNTGKITVTAYLLAPKGLSAKTSNILKQEASHRYLVQNADGDGQCKLVASGSLTAGQMNLVATDSGGGTYYVTKLTSRKALLTQINGTQFATGTYAKWLRSSDGSPQANVRVTIPVS
jgi:hypothetical protein